MDVKNCIECGSEHVDYYPDDNKYYCKQCLKMYDLTSSSVFYKSVLVDILKILGDPPRTTLELILAVIILILIEVITDEPMFDTVNDLLKKAAEIQQEDESLANMDEVFEGKTEQ